MNPFSEIVVLPEAYYVGLQASFIAATSPESNNNLVIPALWNDFFAIANRIQSNDPDGAFYGLCASPEYVGSERKRPDEALYLAAAKVDQDASVPKNTCRWTTPAGFYAKFEHAGPVFRLGETMAYIYQKWIPNHRAEHAFSPDIERYDHRFDPFSDDSFMDIFIPIVIK